MTRRLPSGVSDVRAAFALVIGMLLAGYVVPLASSADDVDSSVTVGAPSLGAGATVAGGLGSAGPGGSPGVSSATLGGTGGGGTGEIGASAAGGGAATGTATAAGGTGTDEPRRASDQGVTEDTIKIGVTIIDIDTLSATGIGATNGTVEERQRVWEALIEDANGAGGAAGRTITAAFGSWDGLADRNAADNLCRRLAEDEHVFAVLPDAGWFDQEALCLTRQYGLPTISFQPVDSTTLAASNGLLFTTMANNDRILYNHVLALHDRGLLTGRRIGLVTFQGYTAYDRTEIPTLESLGYEIVHRSELSDDLSTGQGQIPIEVNQMRGKGVDFIIFEGGVVYSNLWLNQAQRAGYNPTYSFSDFYAGTDDFGFQTVSGPVDGYGWGSRRKIERNSDRPRAESDEACVNRAEAATGMRLDPAEDLYWEVTRYCAQLRAFVDAANAAGPNPTRATFAAAVANLGQRTDLDVGPGGIGGSWVPGKPDAADYVTMMRYDQGCRCLRPEGEWLPMRPVGG